MRSEIIYHQTKRFLTLHQSIYCTVALLFALLHQSVHRNISIPGSQVIPVGLFNVLDGKSPEDYVARVEPSPVGGDKLAEYILHMIDQSELSQPPPSAYIGDRM